MGALLALCLFGVVCIWQIFCMITECPAVRPGEECKLPRGHKGEHAFDDDGTGVYW